jgi:peptidyl-dipeptidase Dcp
MDSPLVKAPQISPTSNPLLADWNTPYGLPPFAEMSAEDFVPAFSVALKAHRDELDAIANNPGDATFENTLIALDRAGRLLNRIELAFDNLTASETSPALQTAEREMAAPLAAHGNAIYMNAKLFKRIDALFQHRQSLNLNAEELRMLERVHTDFVRAGARLAPAEQKRYAELIEQLAVLTTQFSQNVLADEARFQLVLKTDDDLLGLPESLRTSAKQAAIERGLADVYVITLSRSLVMPFLTMSDRRDLREIAYKAWAQRGEHAGSHDNRAIAANIIKLRLEQANLQGYKNYAEFSVADNMAATPAAVDDLLMKVWDRAKPKALLERDALQAMATSLGHEINIEAWDWRYYAEKVRKARYDFDESAVKPYFSLDRMVEALFDCAHRLFGITMVLKPEIKAYHPDVKVYEVMNKHKKLIGVFLHDNFARSTKRGGAWMNLYRYQSGIEYGTAPCTLPIVVNNNNFAKGGDESAGGQPTLLSFDDARTLFHEFGHGLHGLLSNVEYERLSGTRVLRDFVELPSQLLEHWLSEPQVLKQHARHIETGEAISDEILARLQAARKFNQGFETVEFVSSALVDMALHGITDADQIDITTFEATQLARIGMPREISMRHRLPHFNHLFSSPAYAAGYYVYLWAEVLDADGYQTFVEAGNPFDPATANRLLTYIYSSGNSLPPMKAYEAFRGRAPTAEAMLKKKGLIEA